MSKILKNTTASPVMVADTGVLIAASSQYTIPPTDYWLWAASGNVVTLVGNSTLIVNDGSVDLTISDGVDYIKGIYQKNRIIGNTDGTLIGNVSDRLKTQNLPASHAPNLTTTGSLTALNSTVSTSVLDGFGTAGIIVTGTWVGTITFEASVDGTNWQSMTAQPIAGGVLSSTTTINTQVRINITGMQSVRAKMTAYTSGTANITIECTSHAGFVRAISTLTGGTDGSQIGNTGDRLRVDAVLSSGSVTITALAAACNIIKQNEVTVNVKVETDFPSSTYTVPAGKSFNLVSFCGSYDVQQPIYLRLKKQTGGTGAFVTVLRTSLSVNGQDATNYGVTVPNGIAIGVAGDVFKLTYEPAVGRGNLWAGFFGVEY